MGRAYEREQDRYQIGCLQSDIKRGMYDSLSFEKNYSAFGFQVFSQWDEDGLIQYLINNIEIPAESRKFVEFGVENYTESNTKFLLLHDNWRGVIIDGSEENIEYVKKCNLYWRHELKAIAKFITKDNINDIIKDGGLTGDIGILSVDIDGNDYYVWESIECINPRIVICEINLFYGNAEPVSIPYEDCFCRTKAHYSNLYFGASIQAMVYLGKKKGYSLVCTNSVGNNLFFVRNDCLGEIKPIDPTEAWCNPTFRESRDKDGKLTFLSYRDGLKEIQDLELFDVITHKTDKICNYIFFKRAMSE